MRHLPVLKNILTGDIEYRRLNAWVTVPLGGGVSDGVYGSVTVTGGGTSWSITDGVYGDVTVSGGGTVWTVAAPPAVVTYSTATAVLSTPPEYKTSGSFTIAGVGMTIGKPVHIWQDAAVDGDSVEFDQIIVAGVVTSAVLITCYWSATAPLNGTRHFAYLVGA